MHDYEKFESPPSTAKIFRLNQDGLCRFEINVLRLGAGTPALEILAINKCVTIGAAANDN